jgi:hypothetical protein
MDISAAWPCLLRIQAWCFFYNDIMNAMRASELSTDANLILVFFLLQGPFFNKV